MMIDPKILEDFANKLEQMVPSGLSDLKSELGQNGKALLQSTLARMDLVTREEFDAQKAVLARTRAKLDELEKLLQDKQSE